MANWDSIKKKKKKKNLAAIPTQEAIMQTAHQGEAHSELLPLHWIACLPFVSAIWASSYKGVPAMYKGPMDKTKEG